MCKTSLVKQSWYFLSVLALISLDVQVTRDLEPVIYHDFSLSETGTDVPIHDVTLEQFMYAGNIQSPHGNPISVLGKVGNLPKGNRGRYRSRSVGRNFEAGAIQVQNRMKHTVDFKDKGFKPNTRGNFIQDSLATLEELLTVVPEKVGFNIEISECIINICVPTLRPFEQILSKSLGRIS